MTFLTKPLHDVNNPILKCLCKFQPDIPLNARVIAVQSLENLCALIFRQLCRLAKDCHRGIFPYNIIENFPTSLAHNSAFIDPNNFKFGTNTDCMV